MADGVGVARLVLALVFLVAGWAKLSDRPASQKAVADFGIPESVARSVGVLLPVGELAVAVALLVSGWSVAGGAGAVFLLSFFVVAISASLARGQRPDCNCFGQVHSAPIGPRTLVRNAVLLAGAGLVVLKGPGHFVSSWIDRGDATLWVAVAGGVAVAVLSWFVLNLTAQQGKLLDRIDALEQGGGADVHAHHAHGGGLPIGEVAPAFSLPSTSGETVSLDGLLARERPVVLVFASQECQACAEVLPDIAGSQREYDDALTIAVLSGGDPDINKAKAADHGLATIALQRTDEVAKAYGYGGTPGAVVIWSDGTIATPVVAGSDAVRDLIPYAGTDLRRPSPSSPGPEVGDDAPPIELPDLTGRTVSLADMRGASTLVLFWRQSCGFCAGMLDELREWDRSRSNGAPQLLVVSTSAAAEHEGMDLVSPVVIDARGEAMAAYGANGTPIGLLVDADGRVASDLAVGAVAVMELARVATKVPFLSDEWNALWVAEAATLQPGPGPTGSLEVGLRRADDQVVTFTCYFVEGRMREVVARADDDADLHVEVPESVWHSICEGHHEVLEKVMLNGQMRLTGDRERMRALVPAVWSDEAQALRARVHEQTIY